MQGKGWYEGGDGVEGQGWYGGGRWGAGIGAVRR